MTEPFRHLFVWCGPVDGSELRNVAWSSPTMALVIGQGTGANPRGSTAFAVLGASLQSPKLDNLVASNGLDVSDYASVAVGAFSAGYALADELFKDPASVARCRAFAAFDAYYGQGIRTGYEAFLTAAEHDPSKRAVLTSSNSSGPNGISTAGYFAPLSRKLGLSPIDPATIDVGELKPPVSAEGAGGVLHAHWSQYSHGDHARIVAPQILEHIVSPSMAADDAGGSKAVKIGVTVALAVATAFGLWKLVAMLALSRGSGRTVVK